ncbi:hypothetical protein BKA67DRAFT_647356 [Truncatella angustata]|uniref:Uncharacterized protein n=1 Tax=Truncatella angustata TaxID=152316 RepID=A0A9P8ZXY3_9PEZI|nr:uncharacterized protein BKA67DRAFT_647356 [Truncatella angustata]KAH6653493.1 hypothetical protein BKA67DRAFT_647356 [Truncatella angustata]
MSVRYISTMRALIRLKVCKKHPSEDPRRAEAHIWLEKNKRIHIPTDLAEAALIRHLHSPPQVQCTLKAKSLQDRTSFQSSRKQNSCTRFYNLRKSMPLRANSSHKMLMPLEETVWPACRTWQGQAPLPPKHRPAAAMPVQMPVPELAGYFIFEISGACQEDEESS